MSNRSDPDVDVVNHFVHQSAADRYASARPDFHRSIANWITARTGRDRFERALDVACGTGQSARAMAEIADTVDAVDTSEAMLAAAAAHDRVEYRVASSERLPYGDATFDLLTVGLAFHWFDQSAFLAEAARVLRIGGWLVVYNSAFSGEMLEEPSFVAWTRGTYLERFPSPPRRPAVDVPGRAKPFGFGNEIDEEFAHDEPMTADRLVNYLLTQSNVIARVEDGNETVESVSAWLFEHIRPFFRERERTMHFVGRVAAVERLPTPGPSTNSGVR